MDIKLFGYAGTEARDLEAWAVFAKQVFGCQVTPSTTRDGRRTLSLRLDVKRHRLLLIEGPEDGHPFFGLEVDDAAALAQARRELEAAGTAVHESTEVEREMRGVDAMIHVRDPAGYRLELYHGLADGEGPFTPSRPMGGFKTGAFGMGHAVLVAPDLDKTRDFYTDVLGFGISDYLMHPTRRVFMHINGRHHSIALSERPGFGIAHLMFEVNDFDDVGRSYDIAMASCPDRIFSTLGRHANDYMTSFYVQTPGGFPIELGWGGRVIDPAHWTATTMYGPSLWGHDRPGSPPAARQAADAQRDYAREHGLRAPFSVSIDDPHWTQENFDG